jgi:hypothetical protein
MVKFETPMDKVGKIYLPKPIRDAGITNVIEIRPNASAALIYKKGTALKDLLASLRIITADVEHQLSQTFSPQ